MPQQELLKRVVETLEAAGIEYMVTGSIASSFYGDPRSTHDVDIVTAIRPEDVPALAAAFPPPDYYLDDVAASEAIASGGMFNLIDLREGDKVDFWLLT